MAELGIQAKRDYVSSKYPGRWKEKVAKMEDRQVAMIYSRFVNKEYEAKKKDRK